MNWRRYLSYGLATVWIAVVTAVMIVFHARHNLSFNSVEAGPAEQWLRRLPWESSTAPRTHRVFHLLASECGCSRNVIEALALRPVSSGWTETVMILIPAAPRAPAEESRLVALKTRLERRGYEVRMISEAALLPTQGVPSVAVFIEGRSVYAGGYLKTRVTNSSELGLETFFNEIRLNGGAPPRPIFGCSVAKGLRQVQKPEEWFRITALLVQE